MSTPKELGQHMRYHHRPKQRKQEPLEVSEPVDSIVEGKVSCVKNMPIVHDYHFHFFYSPADQPKTSKMSKKYCKVFSCEYNRGTNNERLFLFWYAFDDA